MAVAESFGDFGVQRLRDANVGEIEPRIRRRVPRKCRIVDVVRVVGTTIAYLDLEAIFDGGFFELFDEFLLEVVRRAIVAGPRPIVPIGKVIRCL